MRDSWWQTALRLRDRRSRRRRTQRGKPSLTLDLLEPRQLLAATPQLIPINLEGDALPSEFVQVANLAFFVAETEEHGRELWKTDGTLAGTVLVKDLLTGPESSDPSGLTELNGQLYFAADDGANGRELWKSDGTAAGTVLVRDIYPGEGYQWPRGDGPYWSDPRWLTNVNGRLFFTADQGETGAELWMTDGTTEGTRLVKDIAPGSTNYGYYDYPNASSPSQLANVNGTLYFAADDGTHGEELWKSDGTEAGTVLVRDIEPGAGYQYYYGDGPYRSSPKQFTEVNGTLFFTAVTREHGEELWKSDGTESGTVMVKDLSPGDFATEYGVYPRSSYPRDLTELNGVLFFTAFNVDDGEELWRSDGTEAGTTMVKDIFPGSGDGTYQAGLTVFQGELYFAAEDNDHGVELWRSDGTDAGTLLVRDISSGVASSVPKYFTVSDGTLYFSAQTSDGTELWASDGTEAGTLQVADLFPGNRSGDPQELFDLDGTLLFSADNGSSGFQLWTLTQEVGIGTVTGTKFEDLNLNGIRDEGEPGIAGLTIYVDANHDGEWTAGEVSTQTDADGRYSFEVPAGNVRLRSTRSSDKIQTTPIVPDEYELTVEADQSYSDLDFGEATLPPPTAIDLVPESDRGTADDDDLTNWNNSSTSTALQFRLTGIATTAEVRLYASDVLIGSTTADSSEILLTTDGTTVIPDGVQSITAIQLFQGVESALSAPLSIRIDTQPPAPIDSVPPLQTQVDEPFLYDVDSAEETAADTFYALADAPDGMAIDQDGVITWTPNSNQLAAYNFQAVLSDSAGNSTTRDMTVSVTTGPANNPPVSASDAYAVDEDDVLTVVLADGVLANDSDPDGTALTATVDSLPAHGELTWQSDGTFMYAPDADFFGSDSFTYLASDGVLSSAPTTVELTVRAVADPPQAVDDTAQAFNDGTVHTFDVLANDSTEPDGPQTLQIVETGPGAIGQVSIRDGVIEYVAQAGFVGTDTFTYTVEDSDGLQDTATVTIDVTDASPNTLTGYVYVDLDGNQTRGVNEPGVPGVEVILTGSTDAGDSIRRTAMTRNDGRYRFEDLPAGTYELTKHQARAVRDGSESTTVAGATTGDNRIGNLELRGGQVLGGNHFGESSVKAEYISVAWFFSSSTSSADVFRSMVVIGEEQAGKDDWASSIEAVDPAIASATNHRPVGNPDEYATGQDQAITVDPASGVLSNDLDPDGESVMAVLVTPPAHGELTLRPNGSFLYTPEDDFTGEDELSYRVSDGLSNSNVTTVKLLVRPPETLIDEAAEGESPSDAPTTEEQATDLALLLEDNWQSEFEF